MALQELESEYQFCCSGCRQVYALLNDLGYEDYFYRLLDEQGGRGVPAQISGRGFQDFDNPAFQDQYVQTSEGGLQKTQLYLEGVHCAACVWLLESLPRSSPGLLSVRLNLANSIAELEWDPERGSLSQIGRTLDSLGYTPHAYQEEVLDGLRSAEARALLIKLGVAAACAMNIMFIQGAIYAGEHHGMASRYDLFFRWAAFLLSLPVVLFSARPFYQAAWAGLRRRVPHMDLPISIALTGAFLYSSLSIFRGAGSLYFDSLSALVALLLGARYLQLRAQRAALAQAASLRGATFVEFARCLDEEGNSVETPIAAVQTGTRVELRSGELVPVDGIILEGRSSLNNAVLTGESEPISVGPGDLVYAGASNLGARLILRVQSTGEETRIGALFALVDQAMSQRAPIVQVADRLSRYFVLCVLGLAGLSLLIWSGDSWELAFEHTVALLVVTCPCALGLATPVAISVALARAAGVGIFIKNAEIIEHLKEIKIALLDKTGTLTKGEAQASLRWGAGLELALALEAHSVHPIAQALRRCFPGLRTPKIEQVEEIPGLGLLGSLNERTLGLGNRALLEHLGVQLQAEHEALVEEIVQEGQSPLFISSTEQLLGIIQLGDPLRPEAHQTIQGLRAHGVRPLILSGDHPAVVQRAAQALGISKEDALGALSPEEKHVQLQALRGREESGRILMLGDGVNDAAALALADVGISIEGSTGASIIAADVVLTRPGLTPVLDLLEGGQRLLLIIKRGLSFSLVYNLVGAALALTGHIGPLLAAVLMPISSITVILSSLGRSFEPSSPPLKINPGVRS